MAEVASLGDIVFEVSSSLVKTLKDFRHSSSARWAVHEIVGGHSVAEYLGAGQGEISFSLLLFSALGINPREEADKLYEMMKNGEYAALIVASEPVGDGDWYIAEIEQTEGIVSTGGEVLSLTLNVTLKEYF